MTEDALPIETLSETDRDVRRSRLFAHLVCIACLILQRFGYIAGDTALFASLPLYVALLGWMLATGLGAPRPRATLVFVIFSAWALLSTLVALMAPDMRFGFSLNSLGAVLVTYALATIGPSSRFDRSVVFDVFLFYAKLCAVLGIAQFVVQFGGLRIFSFGAVMHPLRPVLVEAQFNHNPILHYGSSILRSNGFFLLEPAMWSQTIAIAIVIDYFILGRARNLPLFLVSYLVTFSGTGALSLVLALPFFAGLSAKNFGRVAGLLVLGIFALAIASVAFPAQIGSMLARTQELNYAGSSGYARFIGPFLPMHEFSEEARFLIGYGPGATERYIHHVKGTGNSIAKLLTDYGVIGFMLFTTMLAGMIWRRNVAMLSILAIVTFFVGGGYLLFTPMLVLLFFLCAWGEAPAPQPDVE